jgi:peptide-methionine (R)-S-oxide reductase
MVAYKKTEATIAKLSAERYRVTQQSATERPGTGAFRVAAQDR